jgi:hypothetical protein
MNQRKFVPLIGSNQEAINAHTYPNTAYKVPVAYCQA